MSIRARLLTLLVPPLILFVTLITSFFYWNWSQEIIESFTSRLEAIVIGIGDSLDPEEVVWLTQHRQDATLTQNERYQHYLRTLTQIKRKLPITSLSLIQIEPVKKGERVIQDQPIIYDGQDKTYAYRQVYLIDISDGASHPPAYQDFSESDEHLLYFTKEATVTPIYLAKSYDERLMTGYAPILDKQGNVVALVAADVSLLVIDQKRHKALLAIFLSALATIIFVVGLAVFIANKMSQPVQALQMSALAIAAGDYDQPIEAIEGPREIVELANTLNTMSECLQEHIGRLRDSAVARERMYGEYECSLLLQQNMFSRVVENYQDSRFTMQLLSSFSAKEIQGVQLHIERTADGVKLSFREAEEKGFDPLYDLLTAPADKKYPHLEAVIHGATVSFTTDGLPPPIQKEDFILFYNRGLAKQFQSHQQVEAWCGKVLRHFASEGFELFTTMLTTELNFLANKQSGDDDLHILCVRIN